MYDPRELEKMRKSIEAHKETVEKISAATDAIYALTDQESIIDDAGLLWMLSVAVLNRYDVYRKCYLGEREHARIMEVVRELVS